MAYGVSNSVEDALTSYGLTVMQQEEIKPLYLLLALGT